jgi:GWxTD domain-containing protein
MALGRTAALGALLALVAGTAAAQKLDKDDRQWLDEVRPIMLADEEKTFRELKEKSARAEFKKIFWARRDPTPDTPANEFQDEFTRLRTEADAQFRIAGRPGSQTDCGRVYILLGKPDEMKAEPPRETPALRPAETWTYRDRPGQTFAGGEAKISFEPNCELGQGNRYGEALNKVAQGRIRSMNLVYRRPDGSMATLEEQKPKPSPTQTLLKEPRQDFPLTVERRLTMRPMSGNTYVAFLVHAPAGAVDPAKVIVTASATDASGGVATLPDREINGAANPDGSFTGSVGISLAPGAYTVKVGLLDPASGKGSVATLPVTIADPSSPDVAAHAIALREIREGVAPKPTDPMTAFAFGTTVFQPVMAFTPEDSLMLLTFLYGGAKDEAGKSAVTMSVEITGADGRTVGRLANQKFETPASPTIGPIPLAKYAPGTYSVAVKVTDDVAKKDYSEKVTFEVKGGAAPASPAPSPAP